MEDYCIHTLGRLMVAVLYDFGGNYFANRLREGKLISKIELEKTEKDDDWITIEFGKPDPAVSKFVLSKEED
ncbi:MAG: hypothetical protein U9R44_05215 [Candidatus Omnitrophota bacterium]|nr:hypothetical protein [Candidatus Omnitrophota bacterium]